MADKPNSQESKAEKYFQVFLKLYNTKVLHTNSIFDIWRNCECVRILFGIPLSYNISHKLSFFTFCLYLFIIVSVWKRTYWYHISLLPNDTLLMEYLLIRYLALMKLNPRDEILYSGYKRERSTRRAETILLSMGTRQISGRISFIFNSNFI